MKHKLNQKGIAHNLLIIIVAVVAVVAAAGYFVWDRQKSDEIVASAAGLQFISTSNSGATKYFKAYGCKNPAKTGKGFVVNFAGQKMHKDTYKYRIVKNGVTWRTMDMPGRVGSYVYPPSKIAMPALGTDSVTFSFWAATAGNLPTEQETYRTVRVSSIPNC